MSHVPQVTISFPVGDTSVITIDGDALRTWLRYQRNNTGHMPDEQQQAFMQAIDLVADLVGLDDYSDEDVMP